MIGQPTRCTRCVTVRTFRQKSDRVYKVCHCSDLQTEDRSGVQGVSLFGLTDRRPITVGHCSDLRRATGLTCSQTVKSITACSTGYKDFRNISETGCAMCRFFTICVALVFHLGFLHFHVSVVSFISDNMVRKWKSMRFAPKWKRIPFHTKWKKACMLAEMKKSMYVGWNEKKHACWFKWKKACVSSLMKKCEYC